jgi:DNA (cytosine-5)-methyltransferase 1
MQKTVMSLFCGAGGCSFGFAQAGYRILYASDIDKSAVATYATNFPGTVCAQADVNSIDFILIMEKLGIAPGELDFLIGGPPCQGFSTAGMRFWDDPRNSLLKNYVDALRITRPKWFLMENVEGLLTADCGNYLYEALRAFISVGYTIRVEKVYAHEYGIPQRRKRVIIVGNNLGIDFEFPKPTTTLKGKIFRGSDITLRHAIEDLPVASTNPLDTLSYSLPSPSSKLGQYLRGDSKVIRDHYFPSLSNLQIERISGLGPGQTMKDLPEHLQHESFKKRANRRVLDGVASEKRGGSPSGLKRLWFDEPCLTITGTAIREFIHPELNRPLTLRECARIQTFPDHFSFIGSSQEKIQQIGNAIPPLMAQIFAENIAADYGFDKKKSVAGRFLGFSVTKADAMSPALKNTCHLLENLLKGDQKGLFEL